MTASRLVRVKILVALLFLAATRLFAGPITPFVTIKTAADTTTLIPSDSGNFIAFDPGLMNVQPNPCISNGDVTFWARAAVNRTSTRSFLGCSSSHLKYALLRAAFRSRYNPDLQKSKQAFQEKDTIKNYLKSDTKKT
jgi:hypothetical protein